MSRLSINKPSTRVAMIAVIAFATFGSSGCRYNRCGLGINSCLEKCFSRKHAKYRAADAWEQCPNRCASEHVREGFIDGYVDVALGGRGCTPAVAPSRYWGWQYSGVSGQQAGTQWLQGYPMGALAAQGDGQAYRIAALEVPTDDEFRQTSFNRAADQNHNHGHSDPGPDTIDDTIEFPPAYLDNPSDTADEAAPEATDDLKKAVDDALESAAEEAAVIPVVPTDQLKVQTITAGDGKSIKHLMSATNPKQVTKAATAVEKKITKPIEAIKEVVNDIPQLQLQPNDEVFGFGIE